jgi:hypothetical protein
MSPDVAQPTGQMGELVPEPLLLPCAPLPYKEWGYVVLLIIRKLI